jgi:hypothetical protein
MCCLALPTQPLARESQKSVWMQGHIYPDFIKLCQHGLSGGIAGDRCRRSHSAKPCYILVCERQGLVDLVTRRYSQGERNMLLLYGILCTLAHTNPSKVAQVLCKAFHDSLKAADDRQALGVVGRTPHGQVFSLIVALRGLGFRVYLILMAEKRGVALVAIWREMTRLPSGMILPGSRM